jgi:zinc transport system substrate-binding protein
MNRKHYLKILLLISLVVLIVLVSSCIKTVADTPPGKIRIITSIIPTADFAERIAGEEAEVFSLIPPGASPHSYEPTPGQLERVSTADLFVKVGSGIEFEMEWVDKIIVMNEEMLVVDCSSNIDLIDIIESDHGVSDNGDEQEPDHEHTRTDPHIWLSPVNVKTMSHNIYEGLIRIDPANKEYYYDNITDFRNELDMLDRRIRNILSGSAVRKILVFHPAWTYFAAEYGLEQITVEEGGKEPTLKSMEALITQAKDLNIKVIFASPEFDTKSAEVIASEIGGEVVLISPLPREYISDMEKIATAFENSLE